MRIVELNGIARFLDGAVIVSGNRQAQIISVESYPRGKNGDNPIYQPLLTSEPARLWVIPWPYRRYAHLLLFSALDDGRQGGIVRVEQAVRLSGGAEGRPEAMKQLTEFLQLRPGQPYKVDFERSRPEEHNRVIVLRGPGLTKDKARDTLTQLVRGAKR